MRKDSFYQIYGDKDPDGFYRGESNGRVGLVPGNMISEVQSDVDPAHYNDNLSRPRTLGHMGMGKLVLMLYISKFIIY